MMRDAERRHANLQPWPLSNAPLPHYRRVMLSKSALILAKAAQGPLSTQALRALVAVASPALFRAATLAQQQVRAAQSMPLHSGDDGTFDQAVAARLHEIADHLALAHGISLVTPNQASVRSCTAAVADRLARAAAQVGRHCRAAVLQLSA